MKLVFRSIVVCLVVAAIAVPALGEKKKEVSAVKRDSLNYMELSDGKTLSIRTSVISSPKEGQSVEVQAVLDPKGRAFYKGTAVWTAPITKADYRSGAKYYALVKVTDDQIIMVALWNDRYFVIDKQTGRLIKKGEGDDVLLEHANFVPLKLVVAAPQSGRAMTQQELEELQKVEADPKNQAGEPLESGKGR